MRYARVPTQLTISEIRKRSACLAPGKYVRFVPGDGLPSSHFAPLHKLVSLRETQVPVKKGATYRYAEIGDIEVATGEVAFREMLGFHLPTKRPSLVKHGDILVSTVRTYRKGIGYVAEQGDNLVSTNAVLNICAVTDTVPYLTLLYVYSFLRTDFFVEQVWSMLTRGLYPRMDNGALDKILIPIPPDARVVRYVSVLMQAIIDKQRAIRERRNVISQQFAQELCRVKNPGRFRYSEPAASAIKASGRMDACFWSRELRELLWRLSDYRRGAWESIYSAGYKTRRGPNLAVSVSGMGYYFDQPRGSARLLATPGDITDSMTIPVFRYYGNARKVDTVRRGEVMFAAKGKREVSIGHTYVHLDSAELVTNFDSFLIDSGDISRNIFLALFLTHCKRIGVFARLSDTSNGGSFVEGYFSFLPVPKFSEDKQAELCALYHHDASPPSDAPTMDTFVDWHRRWNASLGVWELDREIKALQAILSTVQDEIIEGRTIRLPL